MQTEKEIKELRDKLQAVLEDHDKEEQADTQVVMTAGVICGLEWVLGNQQRLGQKFITGLEAYYEKWLKDPPTEDPGFGLDNYRRENLN